VYVDIAGNTGLAGQPYACCELIGGEVTELGVCWSCEVAPSDDAAFAAYAASGAGRIEALAGAHHGIQNDLARMDPDWRELRVCAARQHCQCEMLGHRLPSLMKASIFS
jgi:hypothetical protein